MKKYSSTDLILEFSSKNFGAWFRQQRQLRGLWLSDIYRDSGVHQSNLSQIEKGNNIPMLSTAEALLGAIGLEFAIVEKEVPSPDPEPTILTE